MMAQVAAKYVQSKTNPALAEPAAARRQCQLLYLPRQDCPALSIFWSAMLPQSLLFAAPGSLIVALIAGVFGLLIGSFLNVVIHRLPKMLERDYENAVAEDSDLPPVHTDTYNLAVPRSACPHCQHQITALENIPVVSYLMLGGKCKSCKAPISPRYPIIEAVTGLLSAFVVWRMGSGYTGMAALVFMYLMLAMTFIDLDTMFLPDILTLPLLWMGLLLNIEGRFAPLADAVIGAVAGYMSLWTISYIFKKVRNKQGMGNGDFKLLGAFGAWMGWQMLPAIVLLSSIVGSVVGLAMIMFASRDAQAKIPFGPYLAGAGAIALLYQSEITLMVYRYMHNG